MDNWKEVNKLIPCKRKEDGLTVSSRPVKVLKEIENIVKDVCEKIQQLILSKDKFKTRNLIIVQGGYGSGKTTILRSVMDEISKSGQGKIQNVWSLSLNRYSTMESIFHFLASKAKERELRDCHSILSKSETKTEMKLKAARNILSYCDLFVFDDLDAICDVDAKILLNIATGEKVISLATCNSAENIKYESNTLHYLEIPNAEFFSQKEVIDFFKEVYLLKVLCDEHHLALVNKLGQFFASIVFRCLDENLVSAMEIGEVFSKMNSLVPRGELIETVILLLVTKFSKNERKVLFSIANIRMALPIKGKASFLSLLKFGLIYEQTTPKGELVNMQNSVGIILGKILKNNSQFLEEYTKDGPTASILWRYLLPLKLNSLLLDAERHVWPFVPEVWQYKDVINTEERYNLKDVIHKINEYSDLEEIDILQECLYSSLVIGDYDAAAALVFLMDRFTYWQGTSKGTISIVDYIIKKSPETAIAPQVVIRKARLLKNEGDIQGAEKILNGLLQNERQSGRWMYKSTSDYELISSVCTQIKGDILRGLGLWVEAARNLIKSIIGFRSLPKPDKKGWASSLSLLADAFQYMSLKDFRSHMVRQYELRGKHPLLEAISCVEEAARLSIYSPLFYSKNKRRAGELLSLYARLLPEESKEKVNYLVYAATECIEGLRCHKSIASLESREQYYEFVFCVYKLSKVCEELRRFSVGYVAIISEKLSEALSDIALGMYDHYCLSEKRFQHTEWSSMLIQTTLELVKLPRIPQMENALLPAATDLNMTKKTEEDELEKLKSHFNDAGGDFDSHAADSSGEGSLIVSKDDEYEGKFFCLEATVTTEDITDDDNLEEGLSFNIRTAETQQTLDDDSEYTADEFAIRDAKTTCDTAELDVSTEYEASTVDDPVEQLEEGEALPSRLACTEDDNSAYNNTLKENHMSVRNELTADLENALRLSDGKLKDEDDNCIRKEETRTANDDIEMISKNDAEKRFQQTLATLEESSATEQQMNEMREILSVITHASKGRAHDAKVWRYDPQTRDWSTTETLAFVGDMLQLSEDKEGACRDAYMFEYITQEEPMSKYIGKQYKKLDKYKTKINMQQYKQDIICQVTSRYYVTQFNQQLYRKGLSFGQVQFLPAVCIELNDVEDVFERYFNVEPYIDGNFTRITNNWTHVVKGDVQGKDLLLAFSHFSFCSAKGKSIIVDIQGWTSEDDNGATILTDPQIHTWDKKGFGTANRGKMGFQNFFAYQHAKCNDICRALKLARPDFTK